MRPAFRCRPPWWGPDLQTLRDTLRPPRVALPPAAPLTLPMADGGALLALLDRPTAAPSALVVLLHGLGGSSESPGVVRLAGWLRQQGLAVLRLNLRGAGRGRPLATGSYAASCNADLLPALAQAQRLARDLAGGPGEGGEPLPLLAVGLSLGGTMLLNALVGGGAPPLAAPPLAGLALVSSPLDLAASSAAIERPRNRLYQRWLLQRLRRQVNNDPAGLSAPERQALAAGIDSIRAFDQAFTAPRWGHGSVAAYYAAASPLAALASGAALPPTLVLHAADDPWVPVQGCRDLAAARGGDPWLSIVITGGGGHNGFHGRGDDRRASWSDRVVAEWLLRISGVAAAQGHRR